MVRVLFFESADVMATVRVEHKISRCVTEKNSRLQKGIRINNFLILLGKVLPLLILFVYLKEGNDLLFYIVFTTFIRV